LLPIKAIQRKLKEFMNYKPELKTLPFTGKSRWQGFKPFSPICREKFRQLSNEGKAPKPERMGVRCTFYDNAELHKWLADPLNYSVEA
jgi:prophage regulatory protein